VSDGEVKVGSEKLVQEARDEEKALLAREQAQVKNLSLERYRKTIAAQIEVLKAELEVREAETRIELATQKQRVANVGQARRIVDRHRFVNRNDE
jgi:hypothetical protein